MVGRALATVLAIQLTTVAALGQDVTARATVTPNPVGLNSQFVVNVVVNGAQQLDGTPSLPDLDFANLLGSGTTTSLQIINGRTIASVSIQYRMISTREGTFTIPPITVNAGGQQVRTEPTTVTVDQSVGSTAVTSDGTAVEIPENSIFVEAIPSKRRVYVNEPVIVEYRLFTQLPVNRYSVTDAAGSVGFWVEDLDTPGSPSVENVVRDGREYATALIGRKAFFPTGSGERTIQPLSIEASVRLDRSNSRNSIFSRGLFAERVPVVLNTDPIELNVLPVPAGRPSDFSGFVGDLTVDASVDRTSTAANEAVTLRVVVGGTGNLSTLPDPAIDFPDDFEVYPPETTENINRSGNRVRGRKTYEYVLIPRVAGTHTIPAISYSYLDPGSGSYEVAQSDPIRLAVTGESDEAPLIARGGSRGSVTNLREDIRFIHTGSTNFRRRDDRLFESAGFWLVLLAPISVVGAAVGWKRRREKLSDDVLGARKKGASRAARKKLKSASNLVSVDQRKEFHAEVARALRGFLADKLGVSEAGMVLENLRDDLMERGLSTDTIDEYFGEIEACERYRFAPIEVSEEEMRSRLDHAARVMTEMERAL